MDVDSDLLGAIATLTRNGYSGISLLIAASICGIVVGVGVSALSDFRRFNAGRHTRDNAVRERRRVHARARDDERKTLGSGGPDGRLRGSETMPPALPTGPQKGA
jgi:hypothetical protein